MSDNRAQSNMEVVLEETCRGLPHGGDHAVRVIVAEALRAAVAAGKTTLSELRPVARRAFAEATGHPPPKRAGD